MTKAINFTDVNPVNNKATYLIKKEIKKIINNKDFILGQSVKKFENSFSKLSQINYCVGCASGTDALTLALKSLNLKKHHEVIVPAMTYISTGLSVLLNNNKLVYADIENDTGLISIDSIIMNITKNTKAVIPVNLYGQKIDLKKLRNSISKKIFIIEDSAQSHFAYSCHYCSNVMNNKCCKKSRNENFADISCYSFYPSKNLGAYGDGGMVITSNPKINEKVRLLRDHGRTDKYTHIQIGFGERLDTIQAAILRVKLRHLDEWTEKRRVIAKLYNQYLGDTIAKLPSENPYSKHVYHLYVVRVPARDNVANYLNNQGIGSGIHYPVPLHLQPALSYLGYQVGDLPHAELAAKEVMSLPIFPEMKESQVTTVSNTLRQALSV